MERICVRALTAPVEFDLLSGEAEGVAVTEGSGVVGRALPHMFALPPE